MQQYCKILRPIKKLSWKILLGFWQYNAYWLKHLLVLLLWKTSCMQLVLLFLEHNFDMFVLEYRGKEMFFFPFFLFGGSRVEVEKIYESNECAWLDHGRNNKVVNFAHISFVLYMCAEDSMMPDPPCCEEICATAGTWVLLGLIYEELWSGGSQSEDLRFRNYPHVRLWVRDLSHCGYRWKTKTHFQAPL